MTDFRLSCDPAQIDVDRVHRWLSASYWSPGIDRVLVVRALAGSVVAGAYDATGQIGYGRVITDRATFAWLADVYVDEGARGRGVGRALVAHLQDHPALQGLRRWMLVTRDAHRVYEDLGWAPLDRPERFMQRYLGPPVP